MSEKTISELFSLQGKVVLVTGGTGHLGSAMAQAVAEAGARVVISSRDCKRAQAAASLLPGVEAGAHHGIELNHLDEHSIEAGFQAAIGEMGQVDVLINNAHEGVSQDLTNITADQFRRQLDNLTGYFLLSRLFHGHIVQRRSVGSLILIGSMYGQVGSYPDVYTGIGPANSVAYQALKGGIHQLARHLAVYWAGDGVRVNCVSPGPFPGEQAPAELVQRIAAKSPMKRIGTPAEIKGAVVFLASDAASYITGQTLFVDGGWTAW